MAYNSNNEVRRELFNIERNNRGESVVGTLITNSNTGNVSVDIRQYYTDANGESKPTSKGVRFTAEMLMDVVTGLIAGLESDEQVDLLDVLSEVVNKDVCEEEASDEADASDEE